jgi:hypothetical protein
LNELSERHGVPFVVINDPTNKRKGQFLYDGEERLVVINMAYADMSTPLHEYYHPFVRLLHVKNEALFNQILDSAKQVAIDPNIESEELVTEYLAQLKPESSLLERFLRYVRNFLRRTFRRDISHLRTIGDLVDYLEDPTNSVQDERTLTKADADIAQILKGLHDRVGIDLKKDKSGVDYISEVAKLATEQNLTTNDSTNYYSDASGEVAVRLTAMVGDREIGEFSTKFKGKKETFALHIARQIFKGQGKDQGEKAPHEITETILMDGQQVAFQDLVSTLEKTLGQQRVYGKMVHAFIHYKLEKNEAKKIAAKQEATK